MPATIYRIYSFSDDRNNGIPITASRVDAELDQLVATMNLAGVAQATAPLNPTNGAMWYDTTNKQLKVYRSNEWVIQGIVHVATSAPSTPQEGDLWWDKTNNLLYAYDGSAQRQIYPGVPVGVGMEWYAAVAPYGWLLQDGSAVSRSTYSALFNIIGTTYGIGDGSSTFNLPNKKGIIGVGYDATQTEFNALGKTGGEKTHVLTTPEMPAHTHPENTFSGTGGSVKGVGDTNDNSASQKASSTVTSSTGGDGAHNNLQPYLTVNWIIKY
jgi:microcystin-dependent protein